MPAASGALIAALRTAVGNRNVLTRPAHTARFATGFRQGSGTVAAVVRPRDLVALWRVLRACVAADAIVIMQAANTGLTGGSTPDGDYYDRPVVIVSPMAIDAIHLMDEGRQALCLPGSTLHALEAKLAPIGREPHSVIGSSCFGASVVGGVCNNSGGSLIRRGVAYTELALYARLSDTGELELVNHLGIRLPDDPEAMLTRIERGAFSAKDLVATDGAGSDSGYAERLRDVDADTPARFNADPERLYEASGCAGRLAVLAVRVDTFPAERDTATYYIGTNDPARLTRLRREMLAGTEALPIAAEYLHRDCFDIAARYGKDSFLLIRWLGTKRLPTIFRFKAALDRWSAATGLGADLCDRLLQRVADLLPDHLPQRMRDYRDQFEHHLLLKVPGATAASTEARLRDVIDGPDSAHFHCTSDEAAKAFLHRFAAAGAAVRYQMMHADTVGEIVALDIALRRNDSEWLEKLPEPMAAPILHRLYYGHFFCYVFHQDYIVRAGTDTAALKRDMARLLDQRGARYPAEHNVGHLYAAGPVLESHYRALDPTNSFNPGIGKTSKCRRWE